MEEILQAGFAVGGTMIVTLVTKCLLILHYRQTGQIGPQCPNCRKGVLRPIKVDRDYVWRCSRFKNGCRSIFEGTQERPLYKQILSKSTRNDATTTDLNEDSLLGAQLK